MRYEQEIREILTEFYEDWMNEKDKQVFSDAVIKEYGLKLSAQLDLGISNGFSIDYQLKLTKILLRQLL